MRDRIVRPCPGSYLARAGGMTFSSRAVSCISFAGIKAIDARRIFRSKEGQIFSYIGPTRRQDDSVQCDLRLYRRHQGEVGLDGQNATAYLRTGWRRRDFRARFRTSDIPAYDGRRNVLVGRHLREPQSVRVICSGCRRDRGRHADTRAAYVEVVGRCRIACKRLRPGIALLRRLQAAEIARALLRPKCCCSTSRRLGAIPSNREFDAPHSQIAASGIAVVLSNITCKLGGGFHEHLDRFRLNRGRALVGGTPQEGPQQPRL